MSRNGARPSPISVVSGAPRPTKQICFKKKNKKPPTSLVKSSCQTLRREGTSIRRSRSRAPHPGCDTCVDLAFFYQKSKEPQGGKSEENGWIRQIYGSLPEGEEEGLQTGEQGEAEEEDERGEGWCTVPGPLPKAWTSTSSGQWPSHPGHWSWINAWIRCSLSTNSFFIFTYSYSYVSVTL